MLRPPLALSDMVFGLFLPSKQLNGVLYWLSRLTCDDTNVFSKANALKQQSEKSLQLWHPIRLLAVTKSRMIQSMTLDTLLDCSCIDATQEPYDANYNMYSYITKDLPALLQREFGLEGPKSISGHST